MAAADVKGKVLSADDVVTIFESIDVNGDGKVSPSEFGMLLARLGVAMSESRRAALFDSADKDGNGSLDIEELAEFLSSAPVESESTVAARAVRAALVAQYYIAAARKSLDASASTVAKTHSFELAVDVNGGSVEGTAASTISIVANRDISALTASLQAKRNGTRIVISLAEDANQDEIAAVLTSVGGESGTELDVTFGEPADGLVDMVIEADLPMMDMAVMMLPIPLDEITSGLDIVLRARLGSSLAEVVSESVKLATVAATAELTASVSAAVVDTVSGIAGGGVSGIVQAIAGTTVKVHTGINVLQTLATESDDVDAAVESLQASNKALKALRDVRQAYADDEMPDEAKSVAEAFRGLRSVELKVGDVAVTANIANGAFSLI